MTTDDLTPREISVARLVAKERTVKQIAALLGITDRCVRAYVTDIAARIDPHHDGDDKVAIANWYRAQIEFQTPDYVDARCAIPIRNLSEIRRAS